LELQKEVAIHLVFHVSLHKKKLSENVVTSTTLTIVGGGGRAKIASVTILDRKLMKKGNKVEVMD
jgi:hypothetical protein